MRSSKRARRALEKLGLIYIDATGSHYHFRAPNGRKVTVVLGHTEISEASLKKVCALSGVAWDAFEAQY